MNFISLKAWKKQSMKQRQDPSSCLPGQPNKEIKYLPECLHSVWRAPESCRHSTRRVHACWLLSTDPTLHQDMVRWVVRTPSWSSAWCRQIMSISSSGAPSWFRCRSQTELNRNLAGSSQLLGTPPDCSWIIQKGERKSGENDRSWKWQKWKPCQCGEAASRGLCVME